MKHALVLDLAQVAHRLNISLGHALPITDPNDPTRVVGAYVNSVTRQIVAPGWATVTHSATSTSTSIEWMDPKTKIPCKKELSKAEWMSTSVVQTVSDCGLELAKTILQGAINEINPIASRRSVPEMVFSVLRSKWNDEISDRSIDDLMDHAVMPEWQHIRELVKQQLTEKWLDYDIAYNHTVALVYGLNDVRLTMLVKMLVTLVENPELKENFLKCQTQFTSSDFPIFLDWLSLSPQTISTKLTEG